MTPSGEIRGIELRYVLALALARSQGEMAVAELADEVARQGFSVPGRPSKTISDALRAEVRIGRARRLERGCYGPGAMPRGTEHRILARVKNLRDRLSGRDDFGDWLASLD